MSRRVGSGGVPPRGASGRSRYCAGSRGEGAPLGSEARARGRARRPRSGPPSPRAGGGRGLEGRVYERRSDRHARRGHRRAQCAFKNSMTRWLCDSHYLSRFAALFIDAGAKRSVAEGCCCSTLARRKTQCRPEMLVFPPAGAAAAGATFGGPRWVASCRRSVMIPPLVHQRRPCYDFYFL